MGLAGRLRSFSRPAVLGLGLAYWTGLGLVMYEMTAKSPTLLGEPLPGWWATERAERTTRWDPPTGLLPLDKLLHEGEEALRFYGILTKRAASGPAVPSTVS